MKIRAGNGEVIDLQEVRSVAPDGINGRTAINLLNALENVVESTDPKPDGSHLKAEYLAAIRGMMELLKPNQKEYWQALNAAVSAHIKTAAGVVDA